MHKKVLARFVLAILLVFQLVGFLDCGAMTPITNPNSSGSSEATVTTPLNSNSSMINVIPVSLGSCGTNGYLNEPCVSVTVCEPGTSTCTTIPNILLDTGSYGLRIFGSVLTSAGISLTQIKSPTGFPATECAQFGSGSMWGPVQSADIGLGSESRVNVPIQVVNSTYTVPTVSGSSACSDLQTDPTSGYNGILGVGVLFYDCGSYCVTNSNLGVYFSCPSTSTCTSTALALSSQVVNPVGLLPLDNNGVILSFPAVSSSGVASTSGTMTIGIGTRTNNTTSTATVLNADEYANFTTTYNGVVDNESFIDSGSNALYFPDSTITQCTDSTGFFCPTSQLTKAAIQKSQTNSTSQNITFYVGNLDTLTSAFSSYSVGVYNNLGGDGSALQFDWGFPFFLGRTIYVGMDVKSSNLASGAYWAY